MTSSCLGMRADRLRSEVTSTAVEEVFLKAAARSLAWFSRLEAGEERKQLYRIQYASTWLHLHWVRGQWQDC